MIQSLRAPRTRRIAKGTEPTETRSLGLRVKKKKKRAAAQTAPVTVAAEAAAVVAAEVVAVASVECSVR